MVGGEGPFGYITMGGMFAIVKVREQLQGDGDPGWYKNPPGTVADLARVLQVYGEERFARRIASAVVVAEGLSMFRRPVPRELVGRIRARVEVRIDEVRGHSLRGQRVGP